MSSLVDASKSEPPKVGKSDMTVKEDPEKTVADARILKNLASYLWPKDNPEFRRRVALALSLLVASKVLFYLKLALGKCFVTEDNEVCDRWKIKC